MFRSRSRLMIVIAPKPNNLLWNGGNGKGAVKLYRGKKLIDELICENVGCEYGQYGSK